MIIMNPSPRAAGRDPLRIDPAIFTFPFSCAGGCAGECCRYGATADLAERRMIAGKAERIAALMDDTQCRDAGAWFDDPVEDADFASGVAAGVKVFAGKCVFLDRDGACTLQRLALRDGVDRWAYKPLYCVLFPLTVVGGLLTIDAGHLARLAHCNRDRCRARSVFEGCREELLHYLGREGFEELAVVREKLLAAGEAMKPDRAAVPSAAGG